VLVYGSIIIKTYRIHAIFNVAAKKLDRITITTTRLAAYVMIWLALDLGVGFGVWQGVTPTQVTATSAQNSDKSILTCRSSNDVGLAVYVSYKVFVLVLATYYAVAVRNVEEKFNESQSLGLSIYVTVSIEVMCILLGFFTRSYQNAPLVIFAVGAIAPLMFTLGAQFIPKFINIIYYREDPTTGLSTRTDQSGVRMSNRGAKSSDHKQHATQSGASAVDDDKPRINKSKDSSTSPSGGGGAHDSTV